MKKWIIVNCILFSCVNLNAQNTFPLSGNVGIGTTSPGYKLTVLGNIYSSGTIGGNGGFYNVLQIPPLGEAPAYFYFDTNIPAIDAAAPQLVITGYTYGASNKSMRVTLSWYHYAGNFYWTQYQSDLGYRKPSRIRVGKYLKNGNQYIRVEIANDNIYWSNYSISAIDPFGHLSNYDGWTWAQGEMPSSTTFNIIEVSRSIDVQIDGRLDLTHTTIDNNPGPVLASYPLATFLNKASNNIYRGLQIGAPTGNITSPVYLKVTGTSNRFSILNQFDQENFSLLDNGRLGIGTNEPRTLLHIHEKTYPDAYLHLTNQNTGKSPIDGLELSSNSDLGANVWNYEYGYLRFATNNTEHMRITSDGKIGIGTTTPLEKFSVNGNVRAKKVIVSQTGWPDYVFDSTYQLKPIPELEKFISKNKHLPDMPSAKEVEENGINIGDNQANLLKKVEELTLYLIEQHKMIQQVLKEQTRLRSENEQLKKALIKHR